MTADKLTSRYTLAEEIFNSVTHGLGTLLSIAAFVILVVLTSADGNAREITSFSIYGFTLFFLYLSSTLYHSVFNKKAKQVLRVFDHISIFLLIAGSYTPITLVSMKGTWGWTLFGIVWALAVAGIILNVISVEKMKHISLTLYILMGWLLIVAIKPMLLMIPRGLLIMLFTGGLMYTFGVIFYVSKRIPFHHGIWHLFVLAGSIIHYMGFVIYLA